MTLGIIGYGDFGTFVHELAREHMPETLVRVHSLGIPEDGTTFFPLEEVCKADVVILAVPIAAHDEVANAIAPLLGVNSIVCNISTVQGHTTDALRRAGISRYVAAHPMFGPYSYEKQGKSLAGLRLAWCESTLADEESTRAQEWLRSLGIEVLLMTQDEHDKQMAETLFLAHLVGQIVTKGGFKRTDIDTLSFGFLMDAAESVAHDEALFRDVYRYNPYCKEVLEKFEGVEGEIAAALRATT